MISCETVENDFRLIVLANDSSVAALIANALNF